MRFSSIYNNYFEILLKILSYIFYVLYLMLVIIIETTKNCYENHNNSSALFCERKFCQCCTSLLGSFLYANIANGEVCFVKYTLWQLTPFKNSWLILYLLWTKTSTLLVGFGIEIRRISWKVVKWNGRNGREVLNFTNRLRKGKKQPFLFYQFTALLGLFTSCGNLNLTTFVRSGNIFCGRVFYGKFARINGDLFFYKPLQSYTRSIITLIYTFFGLNSSIVFKAVISSITNLVIDVLYYFVLFIFTLFKWLETYK